MRGPAGEISGCHQYSPGLSVPVGLPVGAPFVWKDGLSIAADAVKMEMERARTVKDFMSD
jgi:hypothetical protein